jgi:hypothetical protein
MNRRFGWAILVAASVVLGSALGSYQGTHAVRAAAADDSGDPVVKELIAQLKEIKGQVKEINTHLRSGQTKVVLVMNPDLQR